MARQEIVARPGLEALLAEGAQLAIAGARTPLTAFKVRTMHFGQAWRTPGIDAVPFELAVPLQCLAAVMQHPRAASAGERIAQASDDVTPYEALLRVRGWPACAAVLADAELRTLAFTHYGHACLLQLEQWLAADARTAQLPRWVLNTIERIEVSANVGLVRGMARAPVDGDDIKYQDA